MKTFAYLLNDEDNPPKLWEARLPYSDSTLILLVDPKDPEDDLCWRHVTRDEIWEVCSY